MTARFAVGSVSTLAMAAALLVGASMWLNRPGAAQHGTPWGDLSSLSSSPAVAQTEDKAQLMKLAALKTGEAAPASPAPPTTAPVAPAVALPDTSMVSAPTVDADHAKAMRPSDPAVIAAVPAPSAPAAAAPAPVSNPVQVASVEDPAPPAEDAPAIGKSNAVNLNTASAEALDHVGAGRVGRTIVAHRPYRSVKDLVNRRVLRTSDYERIASRVRVD